MFKRDQIGATLTSATTTASVENNTSPFFPGTSIVVEIEYLATAVMTAKIEQSVDDSTWTDLFAPAAVSAAATTPIKQTSATVTCPKFIRGNVTAYTSGSALFFKMGGV